jgi:hypothetical protein
MVLVYRAKRTPPGRRNKKAKVATAAWAMIIFSYDKRGRLADDEEDEDEDDPLVESALVRSKVRVPDVRCCCSEELAAAEGLVVPKAQISGTCEADPCRGIST